MTAPSITCAHDAGDFLGESPLWSPRERVLYWINCEDPPRLSRLDPASGAVTRWPMPERIGAVALGPNRRLLIGLARGIHDFDPATGELSLRAASPLPDHLVLHEGKCDRQGRFWIGTLDLNSAQSGERGTGVWLRLSGGKLIPMLHGVSVANGLAWSPSGDRMYRADSLTRQIFVHPYDVNTGTPGPARLFDEIVLADGMPDGAAVDAEGGYWSALFMGARLRRYRPDGSIEREIALPIEKPTMPAFGGDALSTLYVTSTRHGEPADALHKSQLGSLFSIDAGITGIAEACFNEKA